MSKQRDRQGRFATKTKKPTGPMRTLTIPADKALTVALGKTKPFSYSRPETAMEIFIPPYDWMRWADIIQQNPTDSVYFLAAATSPYMLLPLEGLPTDRFTDFTNPAFDLSRAFPNQEWPQEWDGRLAVFIIDAVTAAGWLVDNPIEV